MKIFLINLERSVQRRKLMTSQLEKLGLDYELVKAVDGHKFSAGDIEHLCDPRQIELKPMWLSPGGIGCTLSHRLLLQRIVDEKIDSALILEDDMILSQEFASILTAIESQLRDDELMMIYWISPRKKQPFAMNGRVNLANGRFLAKALAPQSLMTTGCYAIKPKVAERIISLNTPIQAMVDDWAYFYDNGAFEQIRCVVPCGVSSAFLRSDLVYGSRMRSKVKKLLEDNVPVIDRLVKHYRKKHWTGFQQYEFVE